MKTSLNYEGEVVFTFAYNRVLDIGLMITDTPAPRVATGASDSYNPEGYFSRFRCGEYGGVEYTKWNKTSVRMLLSEWEEITYNKSVEEIVEKIHPINSAIELFTTSDTSTPTTIPTSDIPNIPTSDIQELINTYTYIINAYTSVVKDLQALLRPQNSQAI